MRLDFQELKASVGITQVLDMLAITHLQPNGAMLRGTCPICQTTNPRGFIVTPEKGTWYCFSEKKGGDIIRLVAMHGRTDDKQAAHRIAQFVNGAGKAGDNARPQQEVADGRKSADFDPLAYQKTLDPFHDALGDFDMGTVKELGGGYSSKGLNRGRLVLPIRNLDGSIKAFVGISLKGEEPALLFPKGYLVPYFMGVERVREGVLYVVAGPVELIGALTGGMENTVALLRPITPDTLTSLKELMTSRNCDTLEFI